MSRPAETVPEAAFDFMLARLREEKALATAAGHGCGYVFHKHNAGWVEVEFPTEHNARPVYDLRFVQHFSPQWVLEQVLAREAFVSALKGLNASAKSRDDVMYVLGMLTFLLLPYTEHPSFDQGWVQ